MDAVSFILLGSVGIPIYPKYLLLFLYFDLPMWIQLVTAIFNSKGGFCLLDQECETQLAAMSVIL